MADAKRPQQEELYETKWRRGREQDRRETDHEDDLSAEEAAKE
jgi:hypothetical protein